mgnify:CR=1 FL=1
MYIISQKEILCTLSHQIYIFGKTQEAGYASCYGCIRILSPVYKKSSELSDKQEAALEKEVKNDEN